MNKPDASMPRRFPWPNRAGVLALLLVFAILLCVFLNRCYISMPWDAWTIGGIPVAYWRKPLAAALMASSLWILGLSLGSLFWWLVSWVAGAHWSAGIRRIWAAWACSGHAGWITLLATVSILTTVVFPWADDTRPVEGLSPFHAWFFSSTPFFVRQAAYVAVVAVMALVLRRRSAQAQPESADGCRRQARNNRFVAAVALPVVVIMIGLAGVDWVTGLCEGPVLSMWPLYMLAYVAVSGLAASVVTAWVPCCRLGPVSAHAGALLLSALLFKAYFAYSQFMITAYGALPGETALYAMRLSAGWNGVVLVWAASGLALPIVLLLWPRTRRTPWMLAATAVLILAASALEAWWMVAPAMGFEPGNGMLIAAFGACILVLLLMTILVVPGQLSRTGAINVKRGVPRMEKQD